MQNYPSASYSVEETPTQVILRIVGGVSEVEVDAGLQRVESYPDTTILYWATVTQLDAASTRPVRAKRGQYEAWCYVTAPMKFLFTQGKVAVGDKVLVGFIDGDSALPVIVG